MAPAIINTFITHFSARTTPTVDPLSLGPLKARSVLFARDGTDNYGGIDPHRGSLAPSDINNNALFALFGIIGVAFVAIGIWFFFWAKNGGFYFKETDWDDYKTTVLRRRGPNGTILSGATPSTQLGGGSVYKDIDDGSTEDSRTVVTATTEATGVTGITGGVSDFSGREKRRLKRAQKEREKERRREEKVREKEEKKKSSRKVNEDGVIDEEAEQEAKDHLRKYRHERPARVGGINREADGSAWDGSTNPSNSTTAGTETEGSTVTSDLMSNRERTPTSTPTKQGGIRKVYSAADRNEKRESDRIKAEARRLQEKGRAAGAGASTTAGSSREGRRDFSFQRADDSRLRSIEETASLRDARSEAAYTEPESRVPGSWTESEVGSEVGTKTYRHVIPGLSSAGSSAGGGSGVATNDFAYQDEKRKKRGGAGYRRGRGGDV